MPELPEVETIRADLAEALVGKVVLDVEVSKDKIVTGSTADFITRLQGQTITSVARRGKLLIFKLGKSGNYLLVHLKMTGQLIYRDGKREIAGGHSLTNQSASESLPNKYTHAVITFKDGSKLFYNDLRQFGYLQLANADQLKAVRSKFGPEPLSGEFSLAYWQMVLRRHPKLSIKQLLLRQDLVAGLGNIYADETCHLAGVRPDRKVQSLSQAETEAVYKAIKPLLMLAIRHRGTTFNDYRDASGKKGNFVKKLRVYGRKGESCQKCGSQLRKIKHAGRGTHYCPTCQS